MKVAEDALYYTAGLHEKSNFTYRLDSSRMQRLDFIRSKGLV